MPNSRASKIFLAGTLSTIILLANAVQAQAQLPWGYSPLTGSNSYLWLSRSLFGNGLFRNGYGSGGYLVNSLAYNAVYGVGQGINAIGKKKAAKQLYANPNNGINAPVVDQISAAPWYYPPRVPPTPIQAAQPAQAQLPSAAQQLAEKDPFADPKAGEFMPVPATFNDDAPSTTPAPVIASLPPVAGNANAIPLPAPDFKGSSPAAAQAGTQAASPFIQSFIDHVNDKFDGDVSKAFSDKQTCAYARALGILDGKKVSDLPADRIELIKRILKDPAEDSLTKVNTIRLLLRH